ncbi:MAG: response regulator [Spirochaetes bacterium]|nr:response regulator [Spirochaetota bacterium]
MYRVLIVDDEAEIRSALATYYPWAELGYVVAGRASCATEARAAIQTDTIDVVLCDIRMPGESGLEFAAWLAAGHPQVKVVLLSAYRKFEYAQEAFKYGVKGYLVKPPSEEEFRSVFGALARELDAEAEARGTEPPAREALKAETEGDPVLRDIFAYLRGNIGDACLKAAARAAGMNPTYFSTWFKERTGKSFSTTVTAMRMEKAAGLLAGKDFSVAQAGAELGYSNPKNFSRAFRRHFGSSPRAYRRLNPNPHLD